MPCLALPVRRRKKWLLLFPAQESIGNFPNNGLDDSENQGVDNSKSQILHKVPPTYRADYRISFVVWNVKG